MELQRWGAFPGGCAEVPSSHTGDLFSASKEIREGQGALMALAASEITLFFKTLFTYF